MNAYCRFVRTISKWSLWAAMFMIAAMGLLVFVDIVGTKFLSKPLPATVEMVEELMALSVLTALAMTQLTKGQIRTTLLVERMRPGVRLGLDLFANIVGLVLIVALSWRSYIFFLQAMKFNSYKQGVINLPLAPFKFVFFLGGAFFVLALSVSLIQLIVSGKGKGEQGA